MSGNSCGIELHEVVWAAPLVRSVGQEIMRNERHVVVEAERAGIEPGPTPLHLLRIEVHRTEHDIRARAFAPANNLVVVDVMKAQRVVALQRGMGPSDLVESGQ